MPRIPEQEIDRLKNEISLQRLVEASGIELKRHGADLRGLCPFHDDHDPSLVITPKKNVWHCLGACNKGGSVIDWVMAARGVSFRHAVELLRTDHPSLTAKLERVVRESTTNAVRLEPPFEMSAEDSEVLLQVVEFYHRTLKQSPEALKYLASRGLTDLDMIDHFKIGFANRTLAYRLPMRNRKAGAEIRGRLERLGILRTIASGSSGQTWTRTLGNGVAEALSFNRRQELTGIAAALSSTGLLSLSYGYGTTDNTGRIRSRTDNLQPEHSVNYTYDVLNRLKQATAANSSWSIAWAIDSQGNRTGQTPLGLASGKLGTPSFSQLQRRQQPEWKLVV